MIFFIKDFYSGSYLGAPTNRITLIQMIGNLARIDLVWLILTSQGAVILRTSLKHGLLKLLFLTGPRSHILFPQISKVQLNLSTISLESANGPRAKALRIYRPYPLLLLGQVIPHSLPGQLFDHLKMLFQILKRNNRSQLESLI